MALIKLFVTVALFAGLIYATPLTNNNNDKSLEDNLAQWIQRQEYSVELPYVGSTLTLNSRNLEDDQIDMKVQLSDSNQPQARKSKLKKIFAPILILVILKAITLIPLALGILGLKTWNAIQLSFVTFVISISLAVFELCKKVAFDHVHPSVVHSAPWHQAAKSFAGDLAYSAYTN